MSARDVVLCECFARDGLQHEPGFIDTAVKADLIDRFAALGFERVEATSYSNPKVVPQFAGRVAAARWRLVQGDLRQRPRGATRVDRSGRRHRRQ